ncbi:MAG: YHYH protein [Chitinophagia bacterium]|nr:YHYH protein [Chitinophagia bacterium]
MVRLYRKAIYMKHITLLSLALFASLIGFAQGPEVSTWIRNTTGATGYAGIPSNVQLVQYSTNNVYVSATCIPGYSIGPWTGSPNVASNQNFVYCFPRHPQPQTGAFTKVGMGHIAVFSNGVSAFSATDARSYNNRNVWLQNGYYFEYVSFDNCLGHPQQFGEYHHHASPKCLYSTTDSTHHSPIIGYAFDGYPIYGAYAYTDTNGTGAIKRMRSSFKLRSITDRTSLPDGTSLSSADYGPAISTSFPLGCYIQDYEYVAHYGDLDEHNGRWCKTPEYPAGTYCYFVTLNDSLKPAFPYILGNTYYGVVKAGNLDSPGFHGGHFTITDTVVTYTSSVPVLANTKALSVLIENNPASDYFHFFIQPIAENNFEAQLIDATGRVVSQIDRVQPTISYTFDVRTLPAGIYTLYLNNGNKQHKEKIEVRR